MTSAAERRDVDSLRIAANNVPPYAYEDSDGSMSGVSGLLALASLNLA
jgi:hypothetical protein